MNELEIKELSSEIAAEVKKIMGNGFNVEEREVKKNNGLGLHAINIIEIGRNLAPLFYIEPYIDDYERGKTEEIAKTICGSYIECMHDKVNELDANEVLSFDTVKDRITYKVINAEKNRDKLMDIPHREFLDLAIVYQVNLDLEDEMNPTIMVNNLFLQKWGISEEVLYKQAEENTRNLLGLEIKSMESVIKEMLGEMGNEMEDIFEAGNPKEDMMYVLTNRAKINGAACMLYDDVLMQFAREHDNNFYILPSSVHEILLLPESKEMELNNLKEMVRDVNSSQVAPDEVLSDNVYYYSRKTRALKLCN